MNEQLVLDKYFLIKTNNVLESQIMIPKLRTVMRKLTNKLLSKTQIFSLIDGLFNILHNEYTMETKRLLVYMQDIDKSHWQLSKPQPMPRTPKP